MVLTKSFNDKTYNKMTVNELTQGLKDGEASLEEGVSPDNKHGLHRTFVSWVANT